MNFYLSSHGTGNNSQIIKRLVGDRKIGFIPNAVDYLNKKDRDKSNNQKIKELEDLGINVEIIDLRKYFGRKENLRKKLVELGGVWVRGGNTFILRRAMKLSGFDNLIIRINKLNSDFLYGGYSAGICVLAPELKGLKLVDKPEMNPYNKSKRIIWKGIGLIDYLILPHYKSNHKESTDIDKCVNYCIKHKIKYKPLRDGEVIIIKQ